MPRSRYHWNRSFIQYSYHWCASSGGTKNSSSICSNSLVRNTKFPGVISLRNDLPTCAIPNGGFLRLVSRMFLKLMNMPCAVSGRKYTSAPAPSTGPACVLNMRLKARASVKVPDLPHEGQMLGSSSWSSLCRVLHSVQSTSGSLKFSR